MRIRFTVTDTTYKSFGRSITFIDTVTDFINEHTLYSAFAGEGIIRRTNENGVDLYIEVQDFEIVDNPELVDKLASLGKQIVDIGHIAGLKVTFTTTSL